MNAKILIISAAVFWIALLNHQSDGLFFATGGSAGAITFAGGSSAGGLTAANAGLLLGGLFVAKAVGVGLLAVLLARRRNGNRNRGGRGYTRRYRGRYRGKREAGFSGDEDIDEIDENDLETIKYESELVFRQLEETDPSHCFRRYFCDLSTGKLPNTTTDQMSILNLVAQPLTEKTAGFEYNVASSLGKTFASIEVCESIYNCPLSGEALNQLLT